jgi:hypothetical protein
MTQKEFTEAKAKGLKEREIYYKNKILEDFEGELNQYFNTNRESITIDNKMPFTPKQVVAIINEKYPDLKLKAKYSVCHFGCTIDSKIKIIPKQKLFQKNWDWNLIRLWALALSPLILFLLPIILFLIIEVCK